MTISLPTQGGSSGSWGAQINNWLAVGHNSDGTHNMAIPLVASYALPGNNTYQTVLSWTVTGQTDDPLAAFGLIVGSQTYGTTPPIQGPAFWWGYNPELLSGHVSSSSHGAVGMSCFGDAGDSNNGAGGHGLEMNPACFRTHDGNKGTNAFQMVAVDDNTNTVNAVIRCGTGNSNGMFSGITLCNSDSSKTYMIMGPIASDKINIYQPIVYSAAAFTQSVAGAVSWSLTSTAAAATFALAATGTGNAAYFSAAAPAGTAQLILSGNNASTVHGQIAFQKSGVNKWIIEYVEPYLEILNSSLSPHAFFISGASYAAASTWFLSKVTAYSSLIVGSAAIATTATDGFLYLPSCPGAPTGVPTTQAGTNAAVYDTTNNKIWVYNGSWRGIVVV